MKSQSQQKTVSHICVPITAREGGGRNKSIVSRLKKSRQLLYLIFMRYLFILKTVSGFGSFTEELGVQRTAALMFKEHIMYKDAQKIEFVVAGKKEG